MNLDIQKDKVPLNRITHAVRASQAILQYGVGAMVDFPDQTLMTAAPEFWQERVEQIHDERLEKLLHVDYFGMPGNKDDRRYAEGISYARFPEWYFCPKCRRFQPISAWLSDFKRIARPREKTNDPYMVKHMRCPTCRQDLVVARIITVCEHGHIDDFPWIKWVHAQSMGGARKICDAPKLTFKTGASSTEGLEGLEIFCETCRAKATLKGAFDPGKFESIDKLHPGVYNFICTGKHPWKHSRESCNLYPRVMQRGSSSVYFPVVASSLVIPPYSNMLTTKVESSSAFAECRATITSTTKTMPQLKDTIIASMIPEYAKKIALEVGISVDQAKSILIRKWQTAESEEYTTTSVKYRAEEYEALSGEVSVGSEDYGDFLRESTEIDEYGLPFLKGVSLIHKIREVQALTGFTRIKPAERSEKNDKIENVVSVKEESTNWYPAYQVRGEGIFVEFDLGQISAWEKKSPDIQRRVDSLNEKYKESYIGANSPRKITARFLLLHTISHLLIKQLSFECGYSVASLKERIYCNNENEGKAMAGILIYTASGDSEGTMGGLVRQGRADTFPDLFKKAIESAMTCSNDPVCSLSLGQGRDSLNMAACYSCTLIPETSCEEFNVFLDRGMVVGTFNNQDMGFFSKELYGATKWAMKQKDDMTQKCTVKNNKANLIMGAGTDMTDVPYSEIWSELLQWAVNDHEKELLSTLVEKADDFSLREKPIHDCEFFVVSQIEHYKCDLAWKKSKVAYFSSENEDEYAVAKESDWLCFLGSDISVKWEEILAAIKEK